MLGTLASLAVARHRFFGRETISFLVILPIALPGIVTGIALNSTFTQVAGISLSLFDDRRCPRDLLHRRRLQQRDRPAAEDVDLRSRRRRQISARPRGRPFASSPCPTCARPGRRRALAFALSFDEIIVTTFTIGAGDETLPIWIFNNFSRPNQMPVVNVVAVFVVLLSIIPVYFAHKLTQDEGAGGVAGRGGRDVPARAASRSRQRAVSCGLDLELGAGDRSCPGQQDALGRITADAGVTQTTCRPRPSSSATRPRASVSAPAARANAPASAPRSRTRS